MTKRIFRSIFFAAFCVLLASLAIITGCLYEYYSNAFENQMRDELNLAAAAVDMSGSGYLESIKTDRFRLSLISADGKVIYDTREDADTLANHADREEIKEALETGEGYSRATPPPCSKRRHISRRSSPTAAYCGYHRAVRL